MDEQVHCKLCGATPEGDAEFAMKHFQHRQLEKTGQVRGPMVYVCPRCTGRATYEAKRETGQIK